ncbi:MAG: (d)CMP kinase [Bdellovibrionota bacterium]
MKRTLPVVAIDGPAGSGKSTIARMIAARLHFTHINTGALDRGVALLAIEKGANLDSESEVVIAAKSATFEFRASTDGNVLHIDDRDVGEEIRSEEVGLAASKVSAYPGVRKLLLKLQRDLGAQGGVVLEGRDIGTVVFPEAEVKIFLTASIEARAERRTKELLAKGEQVDQAKIKSEMALRDKQDTTRAVAPLKKADDAHLVDTSTMSIETVLDRLESIVRNARTSS